MVSICIPVDVPELSGTSQTVPAFFFNLVKSDWQKFLNYLINYTILAIFRYKPKRPEFIQKLFNLIAKVENNVNYSSAHYFFLVLLIFNIDLKISTLRRELYTKMYTPEELNDITEKAIVDTGQTGC